MAAKKTDLGQKNFAIGEAKAVFEQWCKANGYDEKRVFLAGLLALQRLDLAERAEMFKLLEKWRTDGFAADEGGVAAVIKTASESAPGRTDHGVAARIAPGGLVEINEGRGRKQRRLDRTVLDGEPRETSNGDSNQHRGHRFGRSEGPDA